MLRLLCAAACLLATTAASAQVKLAYKLEDGRKLIYQTETKTEQTLTIAGMDLETKVTAFQTTSHVLGQRAADGTIRQTDKVDALQVDMQLPGGTSFNFDTGNPNKAVDNAALEPLAKLFRTTAQMATTIVFDRNNQVQSVEVPADIAAQVDPTFQGDLTPEKIKQQTENQRQFLPADPVKPGDAWEVNTESAIGGGQTFSFVMEYRYAGTVEQNGRTLHKITSKPKSVTYAMDPNSPTPLKVVNSDLKIASSEGEILFDNDRGTPVTSHSKVQIVGSMTFSINGQELPGKLNLTIAHTAKLQP